MATRVTTADSPHTRTLPDRMRPHSGANSRARAAEKVYLLANHLAAWGYADSQSIAVVFNCTLRSAENDIRRFRRLGFVKVCRIVGCNVPVVFGTDALFVYADASFRNRWEDFPFLVYPSEIPTQLLTHNLLTRVAVSAMIRDGDFGEDVDEIIPERLYKAWMKRDGIPKYVRDGLLMKDADAIVILASGKRIAIEFEVNQKPLDDRQRIIFQYSWLIQFGYVSRVFYCVLKEAVARIYRADNKELSVPVWHYSRKSSGKGEWLPDMEIGTDKPLMLRRSPEVQKAFEFEHYESLQKRYYPYILKVLGADD